MMTINKELHEFSQAILKKCEEKKIMEQVSPQNAEEIQVQIDAMIEIIKKSLQKQGFSDGEISTFLVTLFQGKYILSIDSKMNGGV
ncbi:hypothetical protein IJM86_01680 [bacterium]|nr:hypothetical protein [bacterium]